MLAKAGAGMLKGGAKKIASKKLLGRGKKKPQKPQQGEQQERVEQLLFVLRQL